jgi:16S rRNA (guanine966-N2)-methyltransferase
MRITGGQFGGRQIEVPRQGVRPTQDRVRQALFNMFGESVAGCRFLDLFAGSGAVGLEALSRGAAFVAWVEMERPVLTCLRRNVETLGGDGRSIYSMDVGRFLKKGLELEPFHIIFADPPYRRQGRESLLRDIAESSLLAPGGWFVLEESASGAAGGGPGWELRDQRRYGDSVLAFLRRAETPA